MVSRVWRQGRPKRAQASGMLIRHIPALAAATVGRIRPFSPPCGIKSRGFQALPPVPPVAGRPDADKPDDADKTPGAKAER
jgi:hypothetical protein